MQKIGSGILWGVPAKVSLIQTPTPLHRLNHLSAQLGLDLWIKRDDLTGLAMGGNKGRKLEYLLAEAIAQRADVVVTCGSTQSNFIRQLGASCAQFGIRCAAMTMVLARSDYNPMPTVPSMLSSGGNVWLDEILGVELHVIPNGTWDEMYAAMEELALGFEAEGLRVFRCPIGGSSALGAYSFVKAAEEIAEQAAAFDSIVFATSSGSTQTGLQVGFHGKPTKIIGIACDPEPDLVDDFAALSEQLADLTGTTPRLSAEDFNLNLDYVGPGYGVPSEAGNAAIQRLARTEGIFLDPIYSGKAFSGLLDLAERGELTGRVLFWHTGGLPALFAMPS